MLLVVAAIVLFSLLAPTEAWASLCMPATLEQQVDQSKVVFVGKVTQRSIENEEQVVVFLVVEALKGVPPRASVTVLAEESKYMWSFQVGGEFLVFARPDGRSDDFRTERCYGDIDMNQAPEQGAKYLAEVRRVSKARGNPTHGRDPSAMDAAAPQALQQDASFAAGSSSVVAPSSIGSRMRSIEHRMAGRPSSSSPATPASARAVSWQSSRHMSRRSAAGPSAAAVSISVRGACPMRPSSRPFAASRAS